MSPEARINPQQLLELIVHVEDEGAIYLQKSSNWISGTDIINVKGKRLIIRHQQPKKAIVSCGNNLARKLEGTGRVKFPKPRRK